MSLLERCPHTRVSLGSVYTGVVGVLISVVSLERGSTVVEEVACGLTNLCSDGHIGM